jgi:GNAT superfamily N-acetyltransferase
MIELQLVEPGHLDDFLQFMKRFYEVDHIEFREERARSAAHKLLSDEKAGRLWWILEEGTRIGYIALTFCFSLEFGGTCAVVDELFLDADYRGRGIGLDAIRYVERFCVEHGIGVLNLEVDRTNVRAQALYKKAGYIDRNNFLLTHWLNEPSVEQH